jgi:hypothetical protein
MDIVPPLKRKGKGFFSGNLLKINFVIKFCQELAGNVDTVSIDLK